LEGSLIVVGFNEFAVPVSVIQEAMRRIKQLEGALGRKTLWITGFSKKLWTLPMQKNGLNGRLFWPGTSKKSGVQGSGRIVSNVLTKKTSSSELVDLNKSLSKPASQNRKMQLSVL
jgi:hypothetical protein